MNAIVADMTRYCARAFEQAEVWPDGAVYLCCGGWVDHPIGNVHRDPLAAIWNNDAAQSFRESIHDDSFRHCVRCPYITRPPSGPVILRSAVKDPRHRQWLERRTTKVSELAQLSMGYDRSCNLSCPSCRKRVDVSTGRLEELRTLQRAVLRGNTLGTVRRLNFTGGEPFVSKIYRELIRGIDPRQYYRLSIALQTNGLLVEPGAWLALGPARDVIHSMAVSIDAATPATYALNRPGGDWCRLLERLDFIGDLRRCGPIRELRLCFVVQANNYREMPAFVEFALRNNADIVSFRPLVNWGTFEPHEYRQRAIHLPEHSEHNDYVRLTRHIPPDVRLSDHRLTQQLCDPIQPTRRVPTDSSRSLSERSRAPGARRKSPP